MTVITFDDNLITGNKTIDEQHKELIDRIQQFVSACESEDARVKAIKMLDYLDEYTEFHFKEEEKLQKDVDYPGLEEHIKKHEEFRHTVKELYDYLDESKLFKGTVVPKDRSLMNVPFVTGDKDLDAKFVKEAKKAGFENLKGHRSVGGMRASIYNAMPIEGVEKLVEFMKAFEKENL